MARKKKAKKKAPSRFSEYQDAAKERIAQNAEKIKELQGKARDSMSENPMQTAAIAFGIGLVCGVGLKLLMDSKRRD